MPASPSMACGKGSLLEPIIDPDGLVARAEMTGSETASGVPIKTGASLAISARTAHIVVLRSILPGRSVPEWAQQPCEGSYAVAENRNENGCTHRDRSKGCDLRTTHLLFTGS